MPSSIRTHLEAIVSRLKTDVQRAWSPRKVFFGAPRTHQSQLPIVVIDIASLVQDSEGSTVAQTAYRVTFTVTLVDKEAAQEEGRMRMIERVDALRNALMIGSVYASGVLPELTSADFATDEEDEAVDIVSCDVAMTIVVDSVV